MSGRRRAVALLLVVLTAAGCTSRTGVRSRGASAPPAAPVPVDVVDGRSDPVADPLYPARGNADLDVLRYDLVLGWAPTTAMLTGTATLRVRAVRPVPVLSLDFGHWYAVDAASVDGTAVTPALSPADKVTLTPAAPLAVDAVATVVLRYHGKPHEVPMPSQRADAQEGLGLRTGPGGEAWTMQEPYGAFTWYPVNDLPSDKARYDIRVTVPAGWSAVASGEYTDRTSGPDGDTFRWQGSDPQASYLSTLAIGHYTKLDLTGPHGLPVTVWTRTGADDALVDPLRAVPEMIGWLEGRFGRYPFRAAGVVTVDSISAMETQEMVTLGGLIARGTGGARARYVRPVLLHELSHQWFGDAVTPRDWRGLWLNEGFATWIQYQWEIDHNQLTTPQWTAAALKEDGELRRKFGPPGAPRAEHFAEHNVYLSGALLLQAIHDRVGAAEFDALLRDWVQEHRDGSVDRAMFTEFANRHTHQDLTALIDAWLDAPTTPPAALGGR